MPTPPTHHLAQVNIARMRAPLDSPVMEGFVARLDELNALAETSPGFVWRFVKDGEAGYVRPYDDDRILFNLSLWESPDALKHYVYRTAHGPMVRQRAQWFEHMDEAWLALWWLPAGERPTIEQAKARLEHLRAHGESSQAFSFRRIFPAPLRVAIADAPLP